MPLHGDTVVLPKQLREGSVYAVKNNYQKLDVEHDRIGVTLGERE